MVTVAQELQFAIERGPEWLLVTVVTGGDEQQDWSMLARQLWLLLERHFTYRLVLDLEQITHLNDELIKQLAILQRWIAARHGTLRVCGLSAEPSTRVPCFGRRRPLPVYEDRYDAVWGKHRPRQAK